MTSMDFVLLSASDRVLDGLRMMMGEAEGYVQSYVPVEHALLIIELAKRAPDHDDWFPRGKWATIQAIQSATDEQLDSVTWGMK
jgi:hypothetical protein